MIYSIRFSTITKDQVTITINKSIAIISKFLFYDFINNYDNNTKYNYNNINNRNNENITNFSCFSFKKVIRPRN